MEAWGIWPKHDKAPFLQGSYASFHDLYSYTVYTCLSKLQDEKILGLRDTNPNVRAPEMPSRVGFDVGGGGWEVDTLSGFRSENERVVNGIHLFDFIKEKGPSLCIPG